MVPVFAEILTQLLSWFITKCLKRHRWLGEIGVEKEKILTVFNKFDLAHTPIKETLEALGMKEESSWVRISAKTGTNCKRLENMIAKLTHGIEKPKEYKKW